MPTSLVDEALRLQAEARAIVTAQEGEVKDVDAFFDRAEGWMIDRHRFAENVPETAADALALLHSLRQVAIGLLPMAGNQEVITGYALELTTGIWSLIRYHEHMVGATRADLGLYDRYFPPDPMN